jgi:LytS/YehU family sensor histidine kinase
MQLNPHFLFNALNAVSALADDDPAAVRRLVTRLSALLRRVLDSDSTPEVPLSDELASIRDYLEIQKIRFGERLSFDQEIAPDAMPALLPSFILQPLVENAVEHAAARRVSGTAHIVIRARRDDAADQLVVTISDNGSGADASVVPEQGMGIGLRNVRERLDAHYGDKAMLTLHGSSVTGTEAEVALPYRTEPANESSTSNA